MIILFTDFGLHGPYQAELAMAASRVCPGAKVISLYADAPRFNPRAAAHLLAAYLPMLQDGDVVVAVIDPGVGSNQRQPVIVNIDGRWLVGPDNGLFDVVMARADEMAAWCIDWRPERLSTTFHGRDLFAPVAALLACGQPVAMTPLESGSRERCSAAALAEVIYIDGFGNAMTGIPGDEVPANGRVLCVSGVQLPQASTFSDMPDGQPFWYINSCGLVELAVNQGSASEQLGLDIGTVLNWQA